MAYAELKKILNGPVLDGAQYAFSVITTHPSMHRVKNAAGATIAMIAADSGMRALTGYNTDGTLSGKNGDQAPLHYDYYADDSASRMARMGHTWAIIGAGGIGAALGSYSYALEDQSVTSTATKAFKDPKTFTLRMAEDLHLARQSEIWRWSTGVTGGFGSSAGLQLLPGPWNQGAALSCAFLGTPQRNKVYAAYWPQLQRAISSNQHATAYGPSSTCGRLVTYLVENPEAAPPKARAQVEQILEPWFGKQVTDAHIDAFLNPILETRAKHYKPGGVPVSAKPELAKALEGMLTGVGLEKHLMKAGLDPAQAMIGRNGYTEYGARLLGGDKMLKSVEAQYRKGLALRHGLNAAELPTEGLAQAATRIADRRYITGTNVALAGMVLSVAGLTAMYRGGAKHHALPENAEHEHKPTPVLDAAETLTNMFNLPTSFNMHRLYCGIGMSFGGYAGYQFSNILSGRTLSGAVFPEEKVPGFAQAVYKKFAYNPSSHALKDRWMQVLHFAIPAVTAGLGVITASNLYFRDRAKRVEEADYLDQYENKESFAQGKAWVMPTMLTAPFTASSGLPFVPFANYGGALGARFMLGNARKVVLPGLGDWWTNTTSRYPQGPSGLRDYMIEYAVQNKDEHPRELANMTRGMVLQWFPQADDKQLAAFAAKVEAVRKPFWKDGGIPPESQDDCRDMLSEHFRGAGLEKTFRELGLDPLHAAVANNGMSGKLARLLGAGGEVDALEEERRSKYIARQKRKDAPLGAYTAQLEREVARSEASQQTVAAW